MKNIIEVLLENKYVLSRGNIYHRSTINTEGELRLIKFYVSLSLGNPHLVKILDVGLTEIYEFTVDNINGFNHKIKDYPDILDLELPEPEYILCAAIKRKMSNVPDDLQVMYKHKSLWESHGKLDDIYFIETARRHPEIKHRWQKELSPKTDDEGFYTSYGRFVDRKTGLKIAIDSGQIDSSNTNDKLFSEDLY